MPPMATTDLNLVFRRLRAILAKHSPPLVVTSDTPAYYSLDIDAPHVPAPRRYVGGVRIVKNYVSFYWMPVYGMPALLGDVSPELRSRMQGKSCFNFTMVDEPMLRELDALTVPSLAAYGKFVKTLYPKISSKTGRRSAATAGSSRMSFAPSTDPSITRPRPSGMRLT